MDLAVNGQRTVRRPAVELPGFPEWSPAGVLLERRLIKAIGEGFEKLGFRALDTASVQPWDVLTAGDGQYSDGGISKPIFSVAEPPESDTGARLGLRYDLTVPLARYIAERAAHGIHNVRARDIVHIIDEGATTLVEVVDDGSYMVRHMPGGTPHGVAAGSVPDVVFDRPTS
jgi:hypothetical protein